MGLFIKQQGQGKPLILLHGWGFNSEIWYDTAETLAKYWTVYQVDLPGHGQSDFIPYELTQLTYYFAETLPKDAIWCGWSLGGLIATAMAIYQPAHVRALMLVCSSPRFVIAPDWPHALIPQALQQSSLELQQDVGATLQRFLALQVRGSDTATQQLRTLRQLLKKAGYPQLQALQAGLHLLQTTDLRAQLHTIQCPAQLCLGEKDVIVPMHAGIDCQKWWPTLNYVCLASAAHLPFLSHPHQFMGTIIEFAEEASLF